MTVKVVSKALFIEGEKSEAIASLRQGFNKLFSKLLSGRMPKIYMGDSITQTIKRFKNNKRDGVSFLLVDLDAPLDEIENRFIELDLIHSREKVFCMVQEMESWFLSQPDVIDQIYGRGTSSKLKNKKPQDFTKPSKVLYNLTKSSKRGGYHKVKDAVDFLERLDAEKLQEDFPQFKKLIDELKK